MITNFFSFRSQQNVFLQLSAVNFHGCKYNKNLFTRANARTLFYFSLLFFHSATLFYSSDFLKSLLLCKIRRRDSG